MLTLHPARYLASHTAAAAARVPSGTAAASQPRALAELLPWLSVYRDGLVLCKDGSLLACIELAGLDADGVDADGAAAAAEAMEHAVRGLDERYTLWSIFERRRSHAYPPGRFPHPLTQALDDRYGAHFRAGGHFRNRHVLCLLFTPDAQEAGWHRWLAQLRKRSWRALWQQLLADCQREQRFTSICQMLADHSRVFEGQIDAFSSPLSRMQPHRLRGEALLSFLNACASPATPAHRTGTPDPALLLDAALAEDVLQVGADQLHFRGVSSQRCMAAISVKAWPDATVPGLISELLGLPCELSVVQVFRCVAVEQAKAHIQSIQRFHLNLQRSAFSFVREALFGEVGQVQDGARAVAAAEAREALGDLAEHRQVYGYFNLSVLVMADAPASLDAHLRDAATVVRSAGFLVLREGLHLLSAWCGSLPGQWGQLVRWHFIHSGHLADLLPLHMAVSGAPCNAYLSEQTGQSCAALAVLPGADRTAYHFNFHVGDLGHCLVVGPSRSGKSVLMNFLIAQFLRYPRARVLIFDKDRSCRIPVILQGGTHLDPGQPAGLRCNPLLALQRPQGERWLRQWLQSLLCLRGYAWSASDDRSISEALGSLQLLPMASLRLSMLQALLPLHLARELAPWVGEGAHAHLFDHVEDDIALHGLACIEMGEILRDEALARLFMAYAFERVETLLAGQQRAPALIYIEEAWFMLAHPVFRERIRDWLKTLPKRLALVVMATQSLEDLSGSGVFSAISDNVPTRIFLANRNAPAQSALYLQQFGLNAAQLTRIARAEPKRQFLVVTPGHSRFIDLELPQALLAVLRSDQRAQQIFDRCRQQGGGDWAQDYLRAVQHA